MGDGVIAGVVSICDLCAVGAAPIGLIEIVCVTNCVSVVCDVVSVASTVEIGG